MDPNLSVLSFAIAAAMIPSKSIRMPPAMAIHLCDFFCIHHGTWYFPKLPFIKVPAYQVMFMHNYTLQVVWIYIEL